MSNDEIFTYIEKHIPRDAKEIERYTDNQNGHREIIEYKSEQLKEIIIDEERLYQRKSIHWTKQGS